MDRGGGRDRGGEGGGTGVGKGVGQGCGRCYLFFPSLPFLPMCSKS